MADSAWAQLANKHAYAWEDELNRGRGRWQDFNPEAAAQFVQDVWEKGRLAGAGGNGIFYADDPIGSNVSFTDPAGTDFTPFARASIAYLRSYRPPRLSGGL